MSLRESAYNCIRLATERRVDVSEFVELQNDINRSIVLFIPPREGGGGNGNRKKNSSKWPILMSNE